MKTLWLLAVVPALLLTACSRRTPPPKADEYVIDSSDVYSLEVQKDRKVKDLHFLKDENTPLAAADKESFKGLHYFAPSKEFAFATVLRRLPKPEPIVMATSKNKPRNMLCIGHLPFTYQGREYALRVYMPTDTTEERYWFIPFTDATTGNETYAAGRFLDVENPRSDSTFLDFNYAYNPYCAYSERYDCPIPPAENKLPIAIRAGEKLFKAGH
jgi:uncharacterized protein